jgi:hypothetical protein
MKIKQIILNLCCLVLAASSLQAVEANPVFKRLEYGFFVHHGWGGKAYPLTVRPDLATPASIDEVGDGLDAEKFANDVAGFNVEYLVFTASHAEMNPMSRITAKLY